MMGFNQNFFTKKRKQVALVVLFSLLIVWLMQGSMVQAETQEQARQQDRFVGFHVVEGMRDTHDEHWVEYGENAIDTGEFGTLAFPNMVLFGEYQEETVEWIFPGMPGSNAFYTTVDVGEDGLSTGYAGLDADVKIAFSTNTAPNYLHAPEKSDAKFSAMVDDTRDSITLSGTVYLPARKGEVFVTYYRVYETKDGRIYLDGSGNTSTDGGNGSGFGMGSTEEETVTINGGEQYTVTTDIHVDIAFVHPCVSLTLLEYNAKNECVKTTSLLAETQTIALTEDTVWCVVQEMDAVGEQRQTALSVADMWEDRTLYHGFVVQTEDDIMESNHLNINVP